MTKKIAFCSRHKESALFIPPIAWLFLFLVLPLVLVLKISLSKYIISFPPYSQMFAWTEEAVFHITLHFENFQILFKDELFIFAYWESFKVALFSTCISLCLAYPMSLALVRLSLTQQVFSLVLLTIPFWTSFLLRIYAWIVILSPFGPLNNILLALKIIDTPIMLLNTPFSNIIGMVYCYLPFMIFPLYNSLRKLDTSYEEAALDLGCRPFKAFWLITLPLTKSGIMTGCFISFIPMFGEFIIPELLGPDDSIMIGKLIWLDFFSNRDWPMAAATTITILTFLIIPVIIMNKIEENTQ